MPYPIEKKSSLLSTNALFNLDLEDEIFNTKGLEAFKKYQEDKKKLTLEKGLAFPFIRRFLNINKVYSDKIPVELVLLSKNCNTILLLRTK